MSQNKQDLNLKGPDSFQVKVAAVVDMASKHSKSLGLVALLLALVAAGVAGFTQWQAAQQEKLAESLAEVEKLFNDEIEAFTKSQQASQDELDKLKLDLQKNKSDAALASKVSNY